MSRTPGPSAVVVEGVPRYDFGDDDCGPGSLATVLTFHGLPVTPAAIGEDLPRTPRGEVLSVDLMLAARDYGFDARWVRGDLEELARVPAAGKPGIVTLRVLNAPGKRRDLYHYAVIDGHDPADDLFRVLLGDGKARWIPAGKLEKTWKGAGHALMVPMPRPAGGLPPDVVFRRAVALERSGEQQLAATLYGTVVDAEPRHVQARVDLGNVLRRLGRVDEATEAYREALRVEPGSVEALNNLAWLLYEGGARLEEAEALARRATAAAAEPQRAAVADTLARILAARGKCEEAAGVVEEAGIAPDPLTGRCMMTGPRGARADRKEPR